MKRMITIIVLLSQVLFVPKAEMSLKNAAILKCHLLDTQKETAIIAEIPLTVTLVAYYTRYYTWCTQYSIAMSE